MLDIFTAILDLIAPLPESVRIIRTYQPTDMGRYFTPQRVGPTSALAHFHAPIIHAAIIANKFSDYPKAAILLAYLLDTWLSTLPPKSTCLTPIPLSHQRERERGYNQVERIIAASSLKNHNHQNLLRRTRDTIPQTNLTRAERLHNLTDAFTVAPYQSLSYERIIIVDDVITTGATLRAASRALQPHLPSSCELLTVAIAH